MITQLSHQVVDCPICGRPVEVQSEFVSRELACGHCRGPFVVSDTYDGGLTAAAIHGTDLLDRADQLLRRTAQRTSYTSSDRTDRFLPELAVLDDDNRCQNGNDTAAQGDHQPADERQSTVLLVEHRDEVFARVATDMARTGRKIIRAKSATEALKLCGTYEPVLVVANLDLPDQSGWLLAGKLQFVDSGIRVWLYQQRSSMDDQRIAGYLQVDQLLDYGGDLLGLSETIVDLMTDWRESSSTICDTRNPAAA